MEDLVLCLTFFIENEMELNPMFLPTLKTLASVSAASAH